MDDMQLLFDEYVERMAIFYEGLEELARLNRQTADPSETVHKGVGTQDQEEE